MRILLVSQMYPGPTAPELGTFVADLEAALAAHCTVGEICNTLREEWGTHDRA